MGVVVPSTEPSAQSAEARYHRRVRPLRAALRWPTRSICFQCAVLFGAFSIYHLWLSSQMQRGLLHLGAVSHKLAPLYAYWDPKLKGGLLLALAVLGAYGFFLRRVLCNDSRHKGQQRGGQSRYAELPVQRVCPTQSSRKLRDWKIVVLLTAWMPVLAIAVAGIDGNLGRIARPFQRTDIEYYGAVGRVADLRAFIGTYPQRAAEMPMHAQTHPPGAVLFLWAATRLMGDTALRAALSAICFSALSVPAVYLLAHDLGGASLARLSAALYLLMPGVVLFTATSMDGPFAVLLIWSIFLGWRSAWRGSIAAGFAAGVVLALAAWMTFSAAVAGLFVVLAVLLAAWCRARNVAPAAAGTLSNPTPLVRQGSIEGQSTRSRHVGEGHGTGPSNATPPKLDPGRFLRSAAAPLLAVLAGGLAFYVPLYAATGYHPADMLGTAMSISARLMGQTGHVSWSQHGHIAAANLVVFFAFCGAPLCVLWLWHTARLLRMGWSRSLLGTLIVAFLVALAVTDLLPLYSLETERIWIFLAPLVAIPAAAELLRTELSLERLVGGPTTTHVIAESTGAGTQRGAHSAVRFTQVRTVLLLLAAQTVLTELVLCTYW